MLTYCHDLNIIFGYLPDNKWYNIRCQKIKLFWSLEQYLCYGNKNIILKQINSEIFYNKQNGYVCPKRKQNG